VYDSLVHMADPRANNRYTYLQIPLLLGYRFFETERLGLTFRTGPALLILLGTRKAAPEISYPNARILLVNEETPSRIQTGWQVWAGINLEYRMTRRMSFYAEPSFKYNLRSPAGKENEQYKAPWAVGLGLGIQYNIGKIRWQP